MEFAHGPERLRGLEEPTFARHNHVLGIRTADMNSETIVISSALKACSCR